MTHRHAFALKNSPGRLMTTAGALCLVIGMALFILDGNPRATLSAFGAADLLSVFDGIAEFKLVTVAIFFAYPALFALSLVGESWSDGRFFSWLGRRVSGSLCLFWSSNIALILGLNAYQGHTRAGWLVVAAVGFVVGGLTVRWLRKTEAITPQPLSRMFPAMMLNVVTILFGWSALVNTVRLSSEEGIIVSMLAFGSFFLLVGSMRDFVRQLRTEPKQIFSREAIHRALESC